MDQDGRRGRKKIAQGQNQRFMEIIYGGMRDDHPEQENKPCCAYPPKSQGWFHEPGTQGQRTVVQWEFGHETVYQHIEGEVERDAYNNDVDKQERAKDFYIHPMRAWEAHLIHGAGHAQVSHLDVINKIKNHGRHGGQNHAVVGQSLFVPGH